MGTKTETQDVQGQGKNGCKCSQMDVDLERLEEELEDMKNAARDQQEKHKLEITRIEEELHARFVKDLAAKNNELILQQSKFRLAKLQWADDVDKWTDRASGYLHRQVTLLLFLAGSVLWNIYLLHRIM